MSYNAKDIQILQGLDAVRMRPGMYIGSTGPRGLHHLLWEIIDNSIDEAANGYCDRIIVTLNADNSVTVETTAGDTRGHPSPEGDNGRGSGVHRAPRWRFMDTSYSYSGGFTAWALPSSTPFPLAHRRGVQDGKVKANLRRARHG